MSSILNGLNDQQQQAVQTINGPLRIVAGAGTGKTRTLTHRIAYMIQQGIDPRQILAVTFTNKAAKEMKERIEQLHDSYDVQPVVRTFHSFGVMILRDHAHDLGYKKSFSILDRDDAIKLLKRLLDQRGYSPKEWEPKKLLSYFGSIRGGENLGDGNPYVRVAKELQPLYQDLKKKESVCDFEDLLFLPVELFQKHPDVLSKYQNRFSHILVDEYQDTNMIQFQLIELLGKEHNNVCVVGDGDQTIYTWRGAHMRNMLEFDKDFPGAVTIFLEKNYRSTKSILDAAGAIIEQNAMRLPKSLIPHKDAGEEIKGIVAISGEDEASRACADIRKKIKAGTKPSDIAILFRANFQSRLLEEMCLRLQIPYAVSGVRFFERKEIKDLMAYITFALNPENMSAMVRCVNYPKRGIGKASLAKIVSGQEETLSGKAAKGYEDFKKAITAIQELAFNDLPSNIIKRVLEVSGIQTLLSQGGTEDLERLANLQELVTYAQSYDVLGEEGLLQMMEQISLMSDQDSLGKSDDTTPRVRLMTIHASKGLEFEHVYIVGLEDGLFPSDVGANDAKRDPEEERRLMYVAVTRAKTHLTLSYARMRTIFGKTSYQTPSPFIFDIPEEVISWDDAINSSSPSDDLPTMYLEW